MLASARVSSLIIQWIILEINMLRVIPLLLARNRRTRASRAIKYFIRQRLASLLFIIAALLGAEKIISVAIITIRLLFKLGIPPFHSWVITLLPGLNPIAVLIILTVQKFIPLIILSCIGFSRRWLALILGSRLVVLLTTIATTSLYDILFLSSIRNGVWIVTLVSLTRWWVIFFIVYCLLVLRVVVLFNRLKIFSLSHIIALSSGSGLLIIISLFNLGGLPPLVGFFIKIGALKRIAPSGWTITVFLILLAFIILAIYTTLVFSWACLPPSIFLISWTRASHFYSVLGVVIIVIVSGGLWILP